MKYMNRCNFCGHSNPIDAVFCIKCGKRIKADNKKKKVLLVDNAATSNFFLTRKLTDIGCEVKSLKSTNFVLDELSNKNYDFFIITLNISDDNNLGFLKTFKKLFPKQNTVIITPNADIENIKLLKSMRFDKIFIKPVKVDAILEKIGQDIEKEDNSSDYDIHDKDSLEELVKSNIKADDITYFIGFVLKDFSMENIKSEAYKKTMDKIFNSLKRSDKFEPVAGLGIIIIPTERMNESGLVVLMNKTKRMIKKEFLMSSGFLKYPTGSLTVADIVKKIENGEFEEKTQEKPKSEVLKDKGNIDINIDKKSFERINTDDVFKNRHLVFSALKDLKDEEVSALYLDKKMKKIVSPYISLSQARIIKENKSDADIDAVKEKFGTAILDIMRMNDVLKSDNIYEKIESDISLMTLPEIQNNIIMLINEEASFKRIVGELQKDAAISGRILKLVNSAFFGFPKQIKNLEKAATILGTEEILGLSLSISFINAFDKNISFIKKLWQHNIAVMSVIKYIENKYSISTSSITPSILSSVGKIFLAQYFPEQYINAIREAQQTSKPYSAVELKHFSIPHSEIGAMITDKWNLPDKIKRVALYYAYPSAFSRVNSTLHLVHAAHCIASSFGYCSIKRNIDEINYYTLTMLSKKHGIDILGIYDKEKDKMKQYIKDMMLLLI